MKIQIPHVSESATYPVTHALGEKFKVELTLHRLNQRELQLTVECVASGNALLREGNRLLIHDLTGEKHPPLIRAAADMLPRHISDKLFSRDSGVDMKLQGESRLTAIIPLADDD